MTSTLYLDLDGVLADWASGAEALVGYRLGSSSDYYPPEDWAKIREHGRIYRNLPLMPGAGKLVDLTRAYRDQLGWNLLFLTAVPRHNDMPWAFTDKVSWAGEYFPDIAVHFGPYSRDKYQHCRPGDILVDDRPDNCKAWRAAEGLAFWVESNDLGLVCDQLSKDFQRRLGLARLQECQRSGRYDI